MKLAIIALLVLLSACDNRQAIPNAQSVKIMEFCNEMKMGTFLSFNDKRQLAGVGCSVLSGEEKI